MKKILALLFSAIILLQSCAIIRPGEIGFRQRLGKIKGKTIDEGSALFNPFITKVFKVNVRTVEVFNNLPLPTKEGLSVNAEISLLYHVNPDSVISIFRRFGSGYEEIMVLSNFRATAREISARYYAKELYATEREKVEATIMTELTNHIEKYGFIVDAVLLKDIILPAQMMQAIENKVTAEQAALQMDFVIAKQKKEAERVLIEAEAIKGAQNIISSSLNAMLLQYNQIEMLKSLSNSPNAKIIITDGKSTPLLLDAQSGSN